MKQNRELLRDKITMDSEISELRELFSNIEDKRGSNKQHELSDILMSAYSLFSLKYPSLLNFEQQNTIEKDNLKKIYGIKKNCSDAQMRKVLDEINPDFIRKYFSKKVNFLEKSGFLSEYAYKIGTKKYLIVSSDGVQHFSSKKNCCDKCLKKKHRNGTVTYHHNMLCAALVHPNKREVFVLDAEPILNKDGNTKNDCERNAVKRLLSNMEKEYENQIEKYNFVMVEDALYANEAHLKDLKEKGFDYITNIKAKSHKTLFRQFESRQKTKQTHKYQQIIGDIHHSFEYVNNLVLINNGEVNVNFLRYSQTNKKGKTTTFNWLTNLKINKKNVCQIMRAGRSRWKIENETFNTLKNLGYHFEHNYGHGKDHLSTLFAFLMLLAFMIDQIIQVSYPIFRLIEKNIRTKIKLWESIKAIFHTLTCSSMEFIYHKVATLFAMQIE